MFMTQEEYKNKRNQLLNKAEKLLENGDIEGYEAKEQEIKNLDEKFKKASKAKANMEALKNKTATKNNFIGDTQPSPNNKEKDKVENPFNTLEYRKEFMNFCQTGEMSNEYQNLASDFINADVATTTSDAGAVIPTTIMEEIIDEMEEYGQIFNRVRKTNIKGGVEVPILTLKPSASWIGEDTTSDKQKAKSDDKVSFTYYGLECKVAISLLADITTLDMFEDKIVDLIGEAMIKAMEKAIISGSGSGQPLGITNDDRVPSKNTITLSSTDFVEWKGWKKKVFAKIPLAYRAGGSFIMAAGTFEGYIDGMTDANGQPIGRTNYGITRGPQERFGGREVILVEDDIVAPYESASEGDIVAVFCKLSDYCINSNMQMTMYRWTDHDNNENVNKALLIADGKILDPNGVIIVKKGA
ncbi:phage major capsid protein [Sporohalobacter salinus]|uniref:phage major capsid protein n=1 Tax=Sporohalobacter salinus TaxID=1494606 RepID=UPI001960D4B5|nr:phage major capsid protein [Sporohalobacter salinus]MBM7624776.1 HK97 family phage major capsid protein [Sporohalobacter salinus]